MSDFFSFCIKSPIVFIKSGRFFAVFSKLLKSRLRD
nr:MAG TPA: hypothetical protein [Caudoviricetes sp.]